MTQVSAAAAHANLPRAMFIISPRSLSHAEQGDVLQLAVNSDNPSDVLHLAAVSSNGHEQRCSAR